MAILIRALSRSLDLPVERAPALLDDAVGRRVRRLAAWHRVTGFLEADPETAPWFGAAPFTARSRAAAALLELRAVLRTLEEAHIPAVPLKGPLLSAQLFGSPFLRGGHDLDILVPSASFDAAVHALTDRYTPTTPSPRLRSTNGHHRMLAPNAGGHLVEIHRAPLSARTGCRIPESDLWSRAAPRTDAEVRYLAFAPAVEAIIVGAHAVHHLGYRLHWVTDVAGLVVRLSPADWRDALELATRWRLRRALIASVEMVTAVFGIAPPAPIAAAVARGEGAPTAAQWIAERLLAGTTAIPLGRERWEHRLALMDGWRQRMVVMAEQLFIPQEEDRQQANLPRWADPLTGALRPLLYLIRAARGTTINGPRQDNR